MSCSKLSFRAQNCRLAGFMMRTAGKLVAKEEKFVFRQIHHSEDLSIWKDCRSAVLPNSPGLKNRDP